MAPLGVPSRATIIIRDSIIRRKWWQKLFKAVMAKEVFSDTYKSGSELKILPTALLGCLILALAPVARTLQAFIREYPFVVYVTAIAPLALIILLFKESRERGCSLLYPAILATGAFLFAWFFGAQPIEFAHLGIYSLLGFSATFSSRSLLIAFALANGVSIGDEVFQYYLPDRYFDYRDLLFNSLGITIGLSFAHTLREDPTKPPLQD